MNALTWDDVQAIAGGRLGGFQSSCPICGPDRPTNQRQNRKVLKLWLIEVNFCTYNCVRCGAKGWVKPESENQPKAPGGQIVQALEAMQRQARAGDRQARDAGDELERQRRSAWAESLFHRAGRIDGPAATYFGRRGITPGGDQRFMPSAPYGYEKTSKTATGIVSAVRDLSGAIVGAHVVYVNPDGSKITKRCFGRIAGHAIQLAPPTAEGVLAVAEGWENAASFAALYGLPCWSAVSAPGVAAFIPPAGLTKLYVAGDTDEHGVGLQAAKALAKRASAMCPVVISMPRAGDWNDVVRAQARRAAA
jgi:hypothetical protein